MTLNDIKGQRLVDIELDRTGVVKLVFENGNGLECDFSHLRCAKTTNISPELRLFLIETKQRRLAQEAHG